jgi:hypothetical protein
MVEHSDESLRAANTVVTSSRSQIVVRVLVFYGYDSMLNTSISVAARAGTPTTKHTTSQQLRPHQLTPITFTHHVREHTDDLVR